MDNWLSYSVLYLAEKITYDMMQNIKDYLSKGIKVFIITSYDINDYIENNEFLLKAINSRILQIVKEDKVNLPYYEEYYDGNISENVKELLHKTEFNLYQYLIEHCSTDDNIIIKAGAGSGKTKTMIDRIMFLKHKDSSLDFSQIAMITFTNEATNEMKVRLSDKISNYYSITKNKKYLNWLQELNKISINTIHRFAKGIIAENPEALGLSSNFIITNFTHRKKKILENYIHKYNEEYSNNYEEIKHIPQYLVINSIMKILEHFDNRALEISDEVDIDIGNEPFSHMLNYLLRNLVKELNKIKLDEDKLETCDLIKRLREISNCKIDNISINYKYLFVDEFQDTDIVQTEFIKYVMDNFSTKIFIVGDIKQSIYRFRGADYTAFESFVQDCREKYDNLKEFKLNINYRSNDELLEKLNSMFRNLNNYVDKFTFTDDDNLKSFNEKEFPTVIWTGDLSSDDSIIKYVKECLRLKYEKEKQNKEKVTIAVLTRSNHQVRQVSELLSANNIFCNVDIKGDFFRHNAVIEFYSLIKGLMYKNVSQNTYALLNSSYGNMLINNNAIIKNYDTEKDNVKYYISNNEEAKKLLEHYYNIIETKPVLEALKEIVEIAKPHIVFGKKKYKRLNDKDDIDMLKNIKLSIQDYEINLDYLLYLINKHFDDKLVTLSDIEAFLRINIVSNKDESRKRLDDSISMDAVNCMTVHKAKGLEFDIVVMPYTATSFFHNNSDVNVVIREINSNKYEVGYSIDIANKSYKNELFSRLNIIEKSEIVGEETRLLYVAATRAKEILVMHSPKFVSNSSNISSWINLMEKGGIV